MTPTMPDRPYLVYHAVCNHVFEHKRFIGAEASYYACPECDAAATEPLHEAAKERASEAAAARNHCRGLAPLSGTPKQVRWAEVIRDDKFTEAEELIAIERAYLKHLIHQGDDENLGLQRPLLQELEQELKQLRLATSARFWIAKKDVPAAELLSLARA